LKDSEPDAVRHAELGRLFAGRDDFIYFCGTVPMTIPAMRAGAEGFVPSAGNVAPAVTRELMDRCIAGDDPGAEAAQARVNAISQVYQKGRSITGSLSAMKAAVSLLGLCQPHMLPPLLPLGEAERDQVREAMREVGLLP
jgi:4-hydroxy-tetrahydrodipicolinate synthase